MTFRINETIRTAMLQQLVDAIDSAATPGKLLLYTGTQPSTAGETTADVLQATITLEQPCADVEDAVATFFSGVEGQRVESDEIGWGRFVDGDDNFVADASVLAVGDPGAADIRIGSTTGYAGSFVSLSSGVIGL